MESKKRKRDDKAQSQDGRDDAHLPRITYHTVHKSFDRLFKERSLEETKRLVRHKLKLASDADVGLEQWREGRLIDLEDDEDFAAFGALARTVRSLEVRVTVDGEGPFMAISHQRNSKRRDHHPSLPRYQYHNNTKAPTTQTLL
ncbi:hypothetical protein PILCRDRAFT_111669 [Piloderma croceum F 1598]|uniref:PB1 domain-containing protein n=1 Tax=Piloderma croceum (strain F 1598) TaxID=765440 RepID=A0A0C3G7C5_PILCF|nr:hypothetical protein PILCRDRAFT_111669 [Piloderma croceum F 1598]